MKLKFTLFVVISFLFFSQRSQAQSFLFNTVTPINIGDTLTVNITLEEGPEVLFGGQMFMELDLEKFKFLSVRSEISDIENSDYEDFFSVSDNGPDSIDFINFIWADPDLMVEDTAQTGDILLQIRLQARENMDDLNDFIYLLTGDSKTSFFENDKGEVIITVPQSSIQEGDGVVSIKYVTQELFAFEATQAGKLSYLIAQIDGKVLATFEREVQVGDNLIDFPSRVQEQMRTGIYILSVTDGKRRYGKKFFAQR